MSSPIAVSLHQKILQLIILPTEKCNFRCTYCYETFEIGKMKPPIVAAIKKLIQARIDRNTLDALSLSWFGGEPLLAKEIVYDIGKFASDLHDQGKLQLITGDLTTNGYLLTPETLAALVERKQSAFQISLDGFGAGHDKTRKYASGKGTFDVIWGNLLAAKATSLDFQITIRCHMTRDNEASMVELVDNICKHFGGDQRFHVFFKTIENLGGPQAANIKSMDKNAAYERLATLEAKLAEGGLGFSSCIDGPESATGKPAGRPAGGASAAVGPGSQLAAAEQGQQATATHAQKALAYSGYVCYAAKPNSLMIRADGTIGKCTVLMDDPRNKVGRINPDGTVTLDSDLVSKVWMRGFASLDSRELGCPAQNLPKLPPREVPIKFAELVARPATA
jgi:uncharacterized protein